MLLIFVLINDMLKILHSSCMVMILICIQVSFRNRRYSLLFLAVVGKHTNENTVTLSEHVGEMT